ncbi:MAG TPA: iron-sulfur cluster assembly scaffold protein [Candidatus Competibacteraceae bacterium]|nr:iron-sulfur cluster assembly scaffold protein [Candidatus Competibacteraceae bacterium]
MHKLSLAALAHFEHPRHAGSLNPQHPNVAAARINSPIDRTILQLHLQVDEEGLISAACFKAYGCGWMIACGSLLTERVLGQTLVKAAQFRHHELVERLAVPPEKLHCAVLTETALKAALQNYAAKRNFATLPASPCKEC